MRTANREQIAIPCVVMRGGTSKGVFFREEVLPEPGALRDAVLLRAMGSPDPRQCDGLGGADPLTSKVAIIGRGDGIGYDVRYTFAQIGTDVASVRYSGNCGNILAAVGPYAIQEEYVPGIGPYTDVRILNTNSGKVLKARVPVRNGEVIVDGSACVAGVPGTGAAIRLDFSGTVGATTGSMLPTGHLRDTVFVPEIGASVEVSIVDTAKATVFCRAADVGLTGREAPAEFTDDVLHRVWGLQRAAADLVGLEHDSGLPTPVLVSEPKEYINYSTGEQVRADEITLLARRVIGPPPRLHKAFAGTGAVCLAVASRLPGTVVQEVSVEDPGSTEVRIGHPSGVFPVVTDVKEGEVQGVWIVRTARRVMDGAVYIPRSSAQGWSV